MAKRKKSRGLWFKIKVYFFLCGIAVTLLLVNWGMQVYRKPSEILSRIFAGSTRTPKQTWKDYGDEFKEKATPILTADFLAALAQAETGGSALAPTFWRFRWTTDLTKAYAPASSAAGLFQLTDATYAEAKSFCIRGGQVFKQFADEGPCWKNFYYSRLVPSHAIEMTAARLHYHVEDLQRTFGRRQATLEQLQSLAAVIHLCGVGRGEQLIRANFDLDQISNCGSHSPKAYYRKIRSLQSMFKSYQGQS